MGPPPDSLKNELSDSEVTRTAMRIALSSLSKLELDSETMDEADVLKKYIALCPYVPPNSKAVQAALQGIDSVTGPGIGIPSLVEAREAGSENSDENQQDYSTPTIKARSMPPIMDAKKNKEKSKPRPLGILIRSILMDMPMVVLFAAFIIVVWVHRVHDLYLVKQLQALVWTGTRSDEEITYYNRFCYTEDLSTRNPNDLFLPEDVTPEEAYHHQMQHGFSVFPNVLSREKAEPLRNFIRERNRNLTAAESIFVIENNHRFSFGLDTSEDCVKDAVTEIGQHATLGPAMEKILGPDFALIEMTAITSTYGAVDQYWHDDVVSEASPVQFAQTFGPSYSIFIQLQDTGKDHGATSACPGSHFCASGPMDRFCERDGFQLVSDDGYWRTGDALLMNMDSWHRGAAHTDPNGPDRVMLILTFAPKPRRRAEKRQMAQGITFSLRWDHWGLTWRDFVNSRFALPWLRALSIVKPPNSSWGIDYISSSSMRIANHDNGFRRDELDLWIERGGISWLPDFLEGQVGDENSGESWYHYLFNTLLRIESFLKTTTAVSVAVYVVLFFVLNFASGPFSGAGRAVGRLIVAYGVVFLLYIVANYHVDSTGWAKDILAGRRYTSAFVDEEVLYPLTAPTTFPHKKDVLIETRYGARWLEMYNSFIDYHPGNYYLRDLVDDVAEYYDEYPDMFKDATANYIVGAIEQNQGRFLHQSTHGTWRLVSDDDQVKYVRTELEVAASELLTKLRQEIRFCVSDSKYGVFAATALSNNHIIPYLRKLQKKLGAGELVWDPSAMASKKISVVTPATYKLSRSFKLTPAITNAQHKRAAFYVPSFTPPEPALCQWCKSGDMIEVRYRDDDGTKNWYMGELTQVSATGRYFVRFIDGDEDDPPRNAIRPFTQYQVGEAVGIAHGDHYIPAYVERQNPDGTLDVAISQHEVLTGVHGGFLRRSG